MKKKNDLAIRLGTQIRRHRLDNNLTQEKLAAALSLDVNSISRFECGTHLPSLERLEQLSEILGISVSGLLGKISANHKDQSEILTQMLEGLSKNERHLIMEVAGRQADFFKTNSEATD